MIVLLKNVKPTFLASILAFKMRSELIRTNKLHAVASFLRTSHILSQSKNSLHFREPEDQD